MRERRQPLRREKRGKEGGNEHPTVKGKNEELINKRLVLFNVHYDLYT